MIRSSNPPYPKQLGKGEEEAYGDMTCQDCEDHFELTDVEGFYTGKCKYCRKRYNDLIQSGDYP